LLAVRAITEIQEKLDGRDEVQAFDGHDEIDRVEVFLAAKAAREIRGGLCCGVELRAARAAEEAKIAFGDLHGYRQGLEKSGDG
jgi:hypothetical protein